MEKNEVVKLISKNVLQTVANIFSKIAAEMETGKEEKSKEHLA